VDAGEALATGGGQSYPVAAQQSVTFTGTEMLAADYSTLGAPDTFDDWSMQRDQQLQQQSAVAQQYIPEGTVGADDLGSYGSWQDTPDWGYAWFPTVAIGWAPYSLGDWVWISPWGWTWVDEEPWGFAPFHYGRWGYWHHRWCWVPGPRRVHPIYAPAMVAWVGGRASRHGGPSATTGGRVGWFALGPRDVYVPGYHASARYVRELNTTNTRIVGSAEIAHAYEGQGRNARFVNGEVPGAVTVVPRNVFTSAQPVAPHRIAVPHRSGQSFRATTAAPAITPDRRSVLGARAGRVVRAPPRALIDRPVVARLAPPRAPVSFAREQAAIRGNGGRPLSAAQLSRMRPYVPAAPVRLMPEDRGTPAFRTMSARERALQRSTLPSAAPEARNDRPPWAQARPMQPRAPMERERFAPSAPSPQRFAPQRQVPQRRFVPQPQTPEEHFVPGERLTAPEQHPVPERSFAPPERAIPEQRFVPERQVPEQHFSPPEREIPQQHFAPAPHFSAPREAPPAPRAAPARAPEPRSGGRPPR
jgi:Family of unknown function (DUF6600)